MLFYTQLAYIPRDFHAPGSPTEQIAPDAGPEHGWLSFSLDRSRVIEGPLEMLSNT